MRIETFREEFRRIRQSIYHPFHNRMPDTRKEPARASHLAIRDVMQAHPVSVRADSPLSLALALMIERRFSGLPVVDADGIIVGSIDEQDLIKLFSEPDARRVSSVMRHDPVVIDMDAPLVEVVDRLMSSSLRRVLVHERGRLVGIVTRSHVMPSILEALDEQLHARGEGWARTERSTTRH